MPELFEAPRADDADICPLLRLERDGALTAPRRVPDEANACIAAGEPKPQSVRQQQLLCLHASHVDCPRYLLGAAVSPGSGAEKAQSTGRLARATVAALLVLVLCIGISFGFVLRRGGIDLSGLAAPTSTVAAVVETAAPGDGASPGPSDGSSSAPASATPSQAPSASTSLNPSPSPSPLIEPSPTPLPSPTTPPAPGPTPSASRLKLLTPCPNQASCYIYKIRSGDTLYSVGQFFGVKLSAIYALNPTVRASALHTGTKVKIPPPTK